MAETERRALIVDDDKAVGTILTQLLRQRGIRADYVPSGAEALRFLETQIVDLVISDLRMPNMDGAELLRELVHLYPDTPVVMLTADGAVGDAVDAMKNGAADFLLKPFDREEVLHVFEKILKKNAHGVVATPARAHGSKGLSPGLARAEEMLVRAAKTNATILLRGESGVGKEVAARFVHDQSERSKGPFVAVNCAALPDNLLESELFGYEKGAFTGAATRKLGRVDLAEKGTLFLDEIGDTSPAFQAKLLRLLQEREFIRLGGTSVSRADVRFVAATHQGLEEMVADGRFREDLWYRLSVLPVLIAPLRERQDDIAQLAQLFVGDLAKEHGRAAITLTKDALESLRAHSWPGNVRELRNVIERIVIMTDGNTIDGAAVSLALGQRPLGRAEKGADDANLGDRRRDAEKAAVLDALARAKNNRSSAAKILGVSRRTLYNKLAELGIDS